MAHQLSAQSIASCVVLSAVWTLAATTSNAEHPIHSSGLTVAGAPNGAAAQPQPTALAEPAVQSAVVTTQSQTAAATTAPVVEPPAQKPTVPPAPPETPQATNTATPAQTTTPQPPTSTPVPPTPGTTTAVPSPTTQPPAPTTGNPTPAKPSSTTAPAPAHPSGDIGPTRPRSEPSEAGPRVVSTIPSGEEAEPGHEHDVPGGSDSDHHEAPMTDESSEVAPETVGGEHAGHHHNVPEDQQVVEEPLVNRVLDSRTESTIEAETPQSVQLIPAEVASSGQVAAVSVTLTATGSKAGGVVTLYSGEDAPSVGGMLVQAGVTDSMTTLVTPRADGTVTLRSSVETDVVVDVHGFYPAHSGVETVAPHRVADTRDGDVSRSWSVQVREAPDVPGDAAAVAVQVTALGAPSSGTVFVGGDDKGEAGQPVVSFAPVESTTNHVWVTPDRDGMVTFTADTQVDVMVDVIGFVARRGAMRLIDPVTVYEGTPTQDEVHTLGYEGDASGDQVTPTSALVEKVTGDDRAPRAVIATVTVQKPHEDGFVKIGRRNPEEEITEDSTPSQGAPVLTYTSNSTATATFVADLDVLEQFWVSASTDAQVVVHVTGVLFDDRPAGLQLQLEDIERTHAADHRNTGVVHAGPGAKVGIVAPEGFGPGTLPGHNQGCVLTAAGRTVGTAGSFEPGRNAWVMTLPGSNLMGHIDCAWLPKSDSDAADFGHVLSSSVRAKVTGTGKDGITYVPAPDLHHTVIGTKPLELVPDQVIELDLADELGHVHDLRESEVTGIIGAFEGGDVNGRQRGNTLRLDRIGLRESGADTRLAVQLPSAADLRDHFENVPTAPNMLVVTFGLPDDDTSMRLIVPLV